jgi:uncharacterized protein YdhG (YjbR/CyaY superfamily)
MTASSEAGNPVDAYIATFPDEIGQKLQHIREVIHEEAPDATEAIKYGIPTFVQDGKSLIHFAGYKRHIGIYPTPSGMDAFASELARYKKSKGTVQLPLDEPLPLDLVRKLTRFRIEEVRSGH